jgi:hypothetical protein
MAGQVRVMEAVAGTWFRMTSGGHLPDQSFVIRRVMLAPL